MKRPPRHREQALVHTTLQTDDVQSFAVHADNYDPEILNLMSGMESKPLGGYLLKVERTNGVVTDFTVMRDDGTGLTHNSIAFDGRKRIRLHTSILAPMLPDEALMVVDLEQYAALSLLGVMRGDLGPRE